MRYLFYSSSIKFSFILLIVGNFFLIYNCYSQLPKSEIGERYFYRGVRSLGMGGVQVSTVNDETALFINPAHLLRLRDVYFITLDAELDFSDTFYWPISKTSPIGNPLDLNSVFNSLNHSPNVNYYFRGLLSSIFASQYFSLGFFSQQWLAGRIDSDNNVAQAFYRDDQSLTAGIALRFLDGHLKIGGAAKLVSRIELDNMQPLPAYFSIDHQGRSGSGLGYDAGVTITLPWPYHPTLSVVYRDIGGIRFDQKIFDRRTLFTHPEVQNQSVDLGFSLFPIHSSTSRSVIAVEAHDLERISYKQSKIRHLHVGYEYNYKDVLFLRTGLNQGLWTLGLEIASEHTQLQLAWYADDMGPDGQSLPSRRYVVKWSYRF
ncbi:MAG: hypothetical protein NZ480_09305 [Bdellovibrionaceae bacterium]|nr:hypothetical protein [Pseudobdellovibrionaceae bacterium]MDW8189745.1 hypothetical protein [Pseudobdellovibrionaceae bacterium]